MATVRIKPVFSLIIEHGSGKMVRTWSRPLLSSPTISVVGLRRNAHMHAITKNMLHIRNDFPKVSIDLKTMKLNKPLNKPICVIMNWMMAQPKHVMKYAQIYLEQGFDVIAVSCSPWQLMWPVTGSQVIAGQLLDFMAENKDLNPIVVHGFSVGAYVWAEALVKATEDKEKYQPTLERIVAQTWDSPADIHEIPVGFPSAVFPKNNFLQETFRKYIRYHLDRFHESATKHYLRATEVFHVTPCRAPALFLVSKTDPVGAEHRSRTACQQWQDLGIKSNLKCWDKSPHVQHFLYHQKEYLEALFQHLDASGVIKYPERLRSRL